MRKIIFAVGVREKIIFKVGVREKIIFRDFEKSKTNSMRIL